MKYGLGLDLAQTCGWAVVELWDEAQRMVMTPPAGVFNLPWLRVIEGDFWGRVVASGSLDLGHEKLGNLYGAGNLPNGMVQAQWLGEARDKIRNLMDTLFQASVGPMESPRAARIELVVCEVPDSFMLGYRENKKGEIRKASDPRTIQSMLRLSAMVFSAFYGSWLFDKAKLECVSPNQWQKPMFYGVQANGPTLEYAKGEQTKAFALSGAWYHLGMVTEDHNAADAALLLLWKYRRMMLEAERAQQLAFDLKTRRK